MIIWDDDLRITMPLQFSFSKHKRKKYVSFYISSKINFTLNDSSKQFIKMIHCLNNSAFMKWFTSGLVIADRLRRSLFSSNDEVFLKSSSGGLKKQNVCTYKDNILLYLVGGWEMCLNFSFYESSKSMLIMPLRLWFNFSKS